MVRLTERPDMTTAVNSGRKYNNSDEKAII